MRAEYTPAGAGVGQHAWDTMAHFLHTQAWLSEL